MEETIKWLKSEWYHSIDVVMAKALKKKVLPNAKPFIVTKFRNCVATLMSDQLQDMCVRSLKSYTDFICDINVNNTFLLIRIIFNYYLSFQHSNPGFKLNVFLENEENLTFSPSFQRFKFDIINIIDQIVKTVKTFRRFESEVHEDINLMQLLRPEIDIVVVNNCKSRILDMLEDQRIGPELRMQDFDKYLSLINGQDVEVVEAFIKSKPSFEEYCDKVDHYQNLEYEIPMDVYGILLMGFYEFHREILIETLEGLSNYITNQLVLKMLNDQQESIIKLAKKYEKVIETLLTVPGDTHELMALKEYAKNTEEKLLPEMEDKLRIVSQV